jgi:hypothetical protein
VARYWKGAAHQGLAAAQLNCGHCISDVKGVWTNQEEAAAHFRLAADQLNYEHYLLSGGGVSKNQQEGARYKVFKNS